MERGTWRATFHRVAQSQTSLNQLNSSRDSLFHKWCWENCTWLRDFLSDPVVKNLISNAGHKGSILSQGTRIPHALGQLSLHTTTTKPTYLNKIPSATTKTQRSQK